MANSGGWAKFSFRPRLGALPGVDVRYLGESCEGCEVCSKNRVTEYVRKPEEIDRLRRILALLRSRGIGCCLTAVDSGLGMRGCAIFSLTAEKVRKVVLKLTQWEIDHTAQLK
jgi:hypothetical protein